VLKKVKSLGVSELVWQRGGILQTGLKTMAARHPACKLIVGGMPATPTMSFDLGADAPLAQTLYVRKMRARGFLVSSYYYVMLAHDEAKIQLLLTAADETMGEIAAIVLAGRLAEESGVARGLRGFTRLA
jgi:glutamate-1-semialdehyde 2,1-aminomutase